MIYEPSFLIEGHKYHADDGTELPSVTTIIKRGLGLYVHKRVSDKALKGTHIHSACQYYDEGDLDEATLDPTIKPYLEQYKLALKAHNIVIKQNETKRYHPVFLFAGSLDKIATVNGVLSEIDIKSGRQENWHKWQSAAYEELMKEETGPLNRYALYLSESDFTLIQHTEENNFREFLALKVVEEIKTANGY